MNWNRREILKAGGLTAVALGLNVFSPLAFQRRILAAPELSKKKLVFIFQRGGNDGVNTVIPRGDPQYNTTNRPTLYIDEADALDLGNGFAQLHPYLQPMMDIYNSSSLTGVAGPGNLAVLQRVGYASQSQSHFDSQQYWENGVPGQPYLEEGMLYRQVAKTLNPTQNHFVAASLSSSQLVALKGPLPLPTLSNPAAFKFAGSSAKVSKFLGSLPSAPQGVDGKGLLGFYGGARDFPAKPYRSTVYDTGVVLADAINIVQDAVAQGGYTPENGAVYPNGGFGDKLRNVAMLLKRTPVQILGVNVGGYDTHTNQGAVGGYHSSLLQELAHGLQRALQGPAVAVGRSRHRHDDGVRPHFGRERQLRHRPCLRVRRLRRRRARQGRRVQLRLHNLGGRRSLQPERPLRPTPNRLSRGVRRDLHQALRRLARAAERGDPGLLHGRGGQPRRLPVSGIPGIEILHGTRWDAAARSLA
jgi:uncharacterized protein (DUF1501 family)